MMLLSKLPRYGFDTQLLQLIGYQANRAWPNLDSIMLLGCLKHVTIN